MTTSYGLSAAFGVEGLDGASCLPCPEDQEDQPHSPPPPPPPRAPADLRFDMAAWVEDLSCPGASQAQTKRPRMINLEPTWHRLIILGY